MSVYETSCRSSAENTSTGTGESATVRGLPREPVTTISSSPEASWPRAAGENPVGASRPSAIAVGKTFFARLGRFVIIVPLETISILSSKEPVK